MLSKKKLKLVRWLSVVVVIAVVFGCVTVASAIGRNSQERLIVDTETYQYPGTAAPAKDAADPAGFTEQDPLAGTDYVKAAENDALILYYMNKTEDDPRLGVGNSSGSYTGTVASSTVAYRENIKIYDKRTGYTWSAVVDDAELLASDLTDVYYKKMQSLVHFKYIDLVTQSSSQDERDAFTYNEYHVLTVETIANGVRFNYVFTNLGLKFAVDFLIEDETFRCLILDEQIDENEDGLDIYEQTKATINEYIDRINEIVAQIENKANSEKNIDEMTLTAIENVSKDLGSLLITIRDETGTGTLQESNITKASSQVALLEFAASDLMQNDALFEEINEKVAYIGEAAIKMSTERSTGMTKVSVLPYFGAQNSKTDGYALYPDDGGAISYFNRVHSTMSGEYSQDIYDEHSPAWRVNTEAITLQEGQTGYNANYVNSALLPVFGIKAGNSAYLAIVAQGDYDAAINFAPVRTSIMDISNAYVTYTMRQSTRYLTASGGQVLAYDSIRTKQDWEVRYNLLANEDADYSGMAMSYRDFLLETNQMKESSIMSWDSPPVGLEYLIGALSARSSFVKEYVAMTRFSDIQDDLEELSSNGINNVLISCYAWEEESWKKSPAPLEINGSVGGVKGLQELAEYTKDKNIVLSLEIQGQWVELSAINSAIASVGTMKGKSLIPFETYGWYVLNPLYYYNKVANLEHGDIRTYKEFGVNCLTTSQSALVYDYNEYATLNRTKAASLFAKVGEVSQQELGYASGYAVDAYMLKNIDWNQYLHPENSGYSFTDEDVPFYQMVMHGSIAYTSSGNNYNYNETFENLRYIEYGYLPYYTLTEEDPFDLINAGYTDFSSKSSSEWMERIIAMCKEYQENLYDVWNGIMKEHTRLSDTLSKVHYVTREGKDVYVYVNYAETDVTADGVIIPAESYKVVR